MIQEQLSGKRLEVCRSDRPIYRCLGKEMKTYVQICNDTTSSYVLQRADWCTPINMIVAVEKFITSLKSTLGGSSFYDPEQLAILYVKVFSAELNGRATGFKDFMRIRLVDSPPMSAQYRYIIDCHNLDSEGMPTFRYEIL